MTDAYKCDKCGNFAEITSPGGARLSGQGYLDCLKDGWYPVRIDICKECSKKLRIVLRKWWEDTEGLLP